MVHTPCCFCLLVRLLCERAVPVSQLVVALETLQAVAVHDGRQLPSAEAWLFLSSGHCGPAFLHFPWVLEQCLVDGGGYIPASAQEALLQLFLGERLASDLGRVADRFRASPGDVVPDAQPETACTAAPSRLPGRPPLGLFEEQAPLAQPPPAACHHPLGLPGDRASAPTHVSLAHMRPVTPLAPSSLPSGAAAAIAPLAEQAPAPNHSSRSASWPRRCPDKRSPPFLEAQHSRPGRPPQPHRQQEPQPGLPPQQQPQPGQTWRLPFPGTPAR